MISLSEFDRYVRTQKPIKYLKSDYHLDKLDRLKDIKRLLHKSNPNRLDKKEILALQTEHYNLSKDVDADINLNKTQSASQLLKEKKISSKDSYLIYTDYDDETEDLLNYIFEIIVGYNACMHITPSHYKSLVNKLTNLPYNILYKLTKLDQLNINLFDSLGCIVNKIVDAKMEDGSLVLDALSTYMTKLQTIASGTTGVAATSNFFNIKDFFIIKFQQSDNEDAYDIYNEAFIAFYGLNRLKYVIPNFAYVYNIHFGKKCSICTTTKCVSGWCSVNSKKTKSSTAYLLYENCNPSISFGAACKTITLSDYTSIFLQTVFSIQVAYEAVDYTHYDLHADNVLCMYLYNASNASKYPPDFTPEDYLPNNLYIEYPTSKKTYYVKCNILSKIIDYGFSHANLNGKDIGNPYIKNNIYNRGFPITDCFRLMYSTLYILYNNNNKVFDEVYMLLFYFIKNTTELSDYDFAAHFINYNFDENKANQYFGNLPYNNVTKKLNIPDFIEYCRINIPTIPIIDSLPLDAVLYSNESSDTLYI